MASSKKQTGPGRPQKYPLTATQEARVRKLIAEGVSSTEIVEKMNIHEYAVLRVRRAIRAGQA